MSPGKELEGKVAVVTGATRGIGREVAIALGRAGAVTVVVDNVGPGKDPTHELIREAGGRAHFKKLDVADFKAAQDAMKETEKEMGGLYILVNNAGVTADQVTGRMKPAQWKKVMDTNLGGGFNCCRAASRIMIRRKQGRIINISSVVARMGRPGQANYAASKAGIEGLTRSLALELGHRGITVNAVAPGYIDTDMTRALPEELRKRIEESIPLGRPGTTEDVAGAVLFLAGPAASYITGQTIHVNGGLFFA